VSNALFSLYINSGEKYLLHKQRWKALRQFLRAGKNKPFSIITFRKIAKAIFGAWV
jgi:hypothetical protein